MASARDAAPAISEEFAELLTDLLSRDPDHRPASAHDVIRSLRQLPETTVWRADVSSERHGPFRSAVTSRVVAAAELAGVRG